MRVLQILCCVVGLIGMLTIEPTITLPKKNDIDTGYVFLVKIIAYVLNFLMVVLPLYFTLWTR